MRDMSEPQRPARNVLGGSLVICSIRPMTGFFRDGCCNTGPTDRGSHTVCVVTTADFLAYSKSMGNDLSTPMPDYGFPGLKPGDRWCLHVMRWMEAYQAGMAPQVVLEATHEQVLRFIPMAALLEHSLDDTRF